MRGAENERSVTNRPSYTIRLTSTCFTRVLLSQHGFTFKFLICPRYHNNQDMSNLRLTTRQNSFFLKKKNGVCSWKTTAIRAEYKSTETASAAEPMRCGRISERARKKRLRGHRQNDMQVHAGSTAGTDAGGNSSKRGAASSPSYTERAKTHHFVPDGPLRAAPDVYNSCEKDTQPPNTTKYEVQ